MNQLISFVRQLIKLVLYIVLEIKKKKINFNSSIWAGQSIKLNGILIA